MSTVTAKPSANGTYNVPEKCAIQIYKTKDYEMFYLLEGNRDINERHVQKLMVSMTEEECMSPIQVNEKMEIIDGQHRFRALQELKKPVYYYIVKGANLKTVQKLNSYTKNWSIDDYVDSYVEAGNKHYIQYKEFKDAYKFGHSINLILLADANYGHSRTVEEKTFKNGEFKVKSIEKAVEIAIKLEELAPFYPKYKARSFVIALIKCIKNKEFKWKTFVHKVSYQQKKMVVCANVEQYLEMIEEVYNYNSKQTDKLILRKVK